MIFQPLSIEAKLTATARGCEMVAVSVDCSVLDRIGKIMSYLRLGSSGKILNKKKKDKNGKEHGQRLLAYDDIANGSLQDLLHFVDDRSKTLIWNARVKVALGTTRALENLKSANILLDEELSSHLSDCGLATLILNTEREVVTQLVVSFGYSPEFALYGIYTVKSDVYSFGVVMLELLTG
ncbi:hypothetical protein L1987_11820 [Smallanthus sonchifolius]|uniref:Uncharacterized protein n=1 Tax=Smallanthus sonchifolius TaxID=185202 RepID=A0ACB9JC18_9ASTR|nr:hypothetical protein L1987_11820 [Smallanthus sonchifolius]